MKIIGIVFIVIVIIALGGFAVRNIYDNSNNNLNTNNTSLTSNTEVLEVDQSMVDLLKSGGSSYLDPKGVFTFLYPNDFKTDTQNNGQYIRFTKTGETQKGQAEIYDGAMMVFEVVDLNGKSLGDYVDSKLEEVTNDSSSEVVSPKTPIKIGNYNGYQYSIRSLGVSGYFILQKNENSNFAVTITTLVADPQNKNYEKEINASLSTIEILK